MISFNFKILILYLSGFFFFELSNICNFPLRAEETKSINSNYFARLISSNHKVEENDLSLEIESDKQYEIDNILYAEGNAVVYFSNATLKGDIIIYDKINKNLTIEGNVIFFKGEQFFEATKVLYDLKNKEGYVENIYGVLDINNFVVDFEFKNIKKKNKIDYRDKVSELQYIDNMSFGFLNDFEDERKFNIKRINFDIPSVEKWRYKSKKIFIKNNILKSEKIIFTNDPLNTPQFLLESRNFSGEIFDEKIKLISRNTWMNLDNKIKFPIGRRQIFDEEPISSWGIGSDYKEKDGFYLLRGFKPINLGNDFDVKLKPYILFQRALKGKTSSFRSTNSSIFSENQKIDAETLDLFALDSELRGEINKWNLNWKSKLNTFYPSRLTQAIRSKFTLRRSINLNKDINNSVIENNLIKDPNDLINITNDKYDNSFIDIGNNKKISINNTDYSDSNKETYNNFLDIKLSSVYRERIYKGYDGDAEIYFGNALNIANRKSWIDTNTNKYLTLIYNFGKFKAESRETGYFNNLYRNVFGAEYGFQFPLWRKKLKDKNINKDFKYTPFVINEGINWDTKIKSAFFYYSNGESQKGISFSSGPQITLGSLKNKFLDFTSIDLKGIYIYKEGASPFEFDNFGDDFRIDLKFEQQIYGPLVFNYQISYNWDQNNYSSPNYGLKLNRRAYSLGASYNTQNESIEFNFQIFNFNFLGQGSKF